VSGVGRIISPGGIRDRLNPATPQRINAAPENSSGVARKERNKTHACHAHYGRRAEEYLYPTLSGDERNRVS